MIRIFLVGLLLVVAGPVVAESVFWSHSIDLLSQGKIDEAEALAQAVLASTPDDADALVVAGTSVLYRSLENRRDDSIFRPEVDLTSVGEKRLSPEAVRAVATYWKRVPALDANRTFLWGDLAQLTFRSGDSARAVEYAVAVLAATSADADSLRIAASVFALNLDWNRAAQCLLNIPGERLGLLYQGLELWRLGKDNWRVPLTAFVASPGPQKTGARLAAYLIGPDMRDTEAGFLAAIQAEDILATLAVRQKYVERYPNKFQPRLDLARSLSQHGSFEKALFHYSEIDRKAIAATPEERLSVLFQEAWAQQGLGNESEAVRLWKMLTEAKDFYIRSAAAWFLGQQAFRSGQLAEAKARWSVVADEPARSKYASWAAAELKKMK